VGREGRGIRCEIGWKISKVSKLTRLKDNYIFEADLKEVSGNSREERTVEGE
jgi:hypothetical protein